MFSSKQPPLTKKTINEILGASFHRHHFADIPVAQLSLHCIHDILQDYDYRSMPLKSCRKQEDFLLDELSRSAIFKVSQLNALSHKLAFDLQSIVNAIEKSDLLPLKAKMRVLQVMCHQKVSAYNVSAYRHHQIYT